MLTNYLWLALFAAILGGLAWLTYRSRQQLAARITAAAAASTATVPDPDDVEAPVTNNAWLYYVVVIGLALGILFLGWYLNSTYFLGINVGYTFMILGLAYYGLGFITVPADRLVGLQFLGKSTEVVSDGPAFVLPGLFTQKEETRSTIQLELPEEPENIFRQDHEHPVPSGMVPPVRITFAQGDASGTGASDDPLDQRITAEVSVFVRFRIRNYWDFFVRIGSLSEARRQLSDMAISELQSKLGNITVAKFYKDKTTIDNELDNLIREKTRNWGIELIDARTKLVQLPKRVNEGIADTAKAVSDKRKTVIDADAKAYDLTKTGEGEANAIKLKLEAESDGFTRMAKDLGVSGADVLAVKAAEKIGSSPSSKVIVEGFKGLAAAGAVLADSFTKPNGDAKK